jgi:hypothetical protein
MSETTKEDARTQRRLKRQQVRDDKEEEQASRKRRIEENEVWENQRRMEMEKKEQQEKDAKVQAEKKRESWSQQMSLTRRLNKNQFPLLVEQLLAVLPLIPTHLLAIMDAYVTRRYLLVGAYNEERISFMDDYEHARFSEFTIDPKWRGRQTCTLFIEQNHVVGFAGRRFECYDIMDTFQIDLIQRRLDIVPDWKVDALKQFNTSGPYGIHSKILDRPIAASKSELATNDWIIMDSKHVAWMKDDDKKMQLVPRMPEEWHCARAGIVYNQGAYYSICNHQDGKWKLRKQASIVATDAVYFSLPLREGGSRYEGFRLFMWGNELWLFVYSQPDHFLMNLSKLLLGTGVANEQLPVFYLQLQNLPASLYKTLEHYNTEYAYGLVWIDSETDDLYFARRSNNPSAFWPIYSVNKKAPQIVHEVGSDSIVARAIRFQDAIVDIPLNGIVVPHHLWFPVALKAT